MPLLCCCDQEAVAATFGVDHCHDEQDSHSTKHDGSNSDHDCSCNCGHELNAVLENSTTLQTPTLFKQHSFSKIVFIEPISVILLKGSINPAYLGPPLGKAYIVPLYIQQHNLRI